MQLSQHVLSGHLAVVNFEIYNRLKVLYALRRRERITKRAHLNISERYYVDLLVICKRWRRFRGPIFSFLSVRK